ncbi:hypothetical protein ACYOEI_12865 [Singulisphaera rosea]
MRILTPKVIIIEDRYHKVRADMLRLFALFRDADDSVEMYEVYYRDCLRGAINGCLRTDEFGWDLPTELQKETAIAVAQRTVRSAINGLAEDGAIVS